jgi:2-dehydropantoate 2-reductase
MRVAVLGPGGVGGLLAGVMARSGTEVVVVARESTAALIERDGIRVQSVIFGDFVARPRAVAQLREPVDALIVATKATGLEPALARIEPASLADVEMAPSSEEAISSRRGDSPVVLPLLNGLDHIVLLRKRLPAESVLAGSIRVEADRPRAGVVVHTSPFLLVSMANHAPAVRPRMQALADALTRAGVPVQVLDSEAQVMWSKLVRLNALACTTSAYDVLLGEIRSTPSLRADLEGAIEEACAVGRAEGAPDLPAAKAIAELEAAHATLGSSMQRDIAAGREPELDAIPGAVLRAGARHGIPCPTIERLVALIEARIAARAA